MPNGAGAEANLDIPLQELKLKDATGERCRTVLALFEALDRNPDWLKRITDVTIKRYPDIWPLIVPGNKILDLAGLVSLLKKLKAEAPGESVRVVDIFFEIFERITFVGKQDGETVDHSIFWQLKAILHEAIESGRIDVGFIYNRAKEISLKAMRVDSPTIGGGTQLGILAQSLVDALDAPEPGQQVLRLRYDHSPLIPRLKLLTNPYDIKIWIEANQEQLRSLESKNLFRLLRLATIESSQVGSLEKLAVCLQALFENNILRAEDTTELYRLFDYLLQTPTGQKFLENTVANHYTMNVKKDEFLQALAKAQKELTIQQIQIDQEVFERILNFAKATKLIPDSTRFADLKQYLPLDQKE